MAFLHPLGKVEDPDSSGDKIEDESANTLSYVGSVAYEVLRKRHKPHHHSLWNVTSGKVVGKLHQTPRENCDYMEDPEEGHDAWFPKKMGEILARTKVFADVMSLAPPDGAFLTEMKKALWTIAERNPQSPVVVRFMFANMIGMPTNCHEVLKRLTEDIPEDANVQVWVGAWRKALSWNHAKIIAVDGIYLHTGGHNMWDGHYLRADPVHDLSFELEGRVTHSAHLYANGQWDYIESHQNTTLGKIVNLLPDGLVIPITVRVTVSEFPRHVAKEFPPRYEKSLVPWYSPWYDHVPLLTLGRYGRITKYERRPSDEAIWAMLGSAKTVIKMALQDIGPLTAPETKLPLPGCVWPDRTLNVLGQAIWRGVDVEMILSNPRSIPGNLSFRDANYGNGWSCVDVAAELMKRMRDDDYNDADEYELRKAISEHLRISYIRHKTGRWYESAMTVGMHAKHFIVDDVCTYIGSQNLYICDLAEWGVVVDDAEATKKIIHEYWQPMWNISYNSDDCDVDAVMRTLDVDRSTCDKSGKYGGHETFMHGKTGEFYDDSDGEE